MATAKKKTTKKATSKASAKKKAGRPEGSGNQEYDHGLAVETRCRQCDSTDREPYDRKTETEYRGLDPSGNACTHIIRRWTKCANCGQARIDRTYENRTLASASEKQ